MSDEHPAPSIARRRLPLPWPALLVIGAAVVALPVIRAVPDERHVSVLLGQRDIDAVELVWIREGEPVRSTRYHFEAGAPERIQQTLRLYDGPYELVIRTERGGVIAEQRRSLSIADDAAEVTVHAR